MLSSLEMLAELRQCQTELEEAANLLEPRLPGMASIYRIAAKRVKALLDSDVVSQKID